MPSRPLNPEKKRKESPMRLTPALVERTLRQYQAQALPDNHPAVPELNRLFGNHTFFLDDNGLNIVEPAEEGDPRRPRW
jgi:hypothetical protein